MAGPRFSIASNAAALAKAWEKRAKRIEPEMRRATAQATKTVYSESRRQMTKLIYDKPVPTRNQEQEGRMQAERGRGRYTGFAAEGVRFGRQKGGGTAYKNLGTTGRKPAWTRTGNLRRSERFKLASAYRGVISNDATARTRPSKGKTKRKALSKGSGKRYSYARARHDMGKPGHRPTRYPAPWREIAIRKTQTRVRGIYRQAMMRAVHAGKVPGLKSIRI